MQELSEEKLHLCRLVIKDTIPNSGIEFSAKDNNGDTSFMYALQEGHEDAVDSPPKINILSFLVQKFVQYIELFSNIVKSRSADQRFN